jgi:hypothetical protein
MHPDGMEDTTPPVNCVEHYGWKDTKDVDYSSSIVKLRTSVGQQLLTESAKSSASQYDVMMRHYEEQEEGSFCGIASSVIVLNTMRAGLEPKLTQSGVYKLVRQKYWTRDDSHRYGKY